jgi:hypothetical protein
MSDWKSKKFKAAFKFFSPRADKSSSIAASFAASLGVGVPRKLFTDGLEGIDNLELTMVGCELLEPVDILEFSLVSCKLPVPVERILPILGESPAACGLLGIRGLLGLR